MNLCRFSEGYRIDGYAKTAYGAPSVNVPPILCPRTKSMIPFIRHAVLLTLLIAAPAAHAQVYKCVDKAGKTVYSQSPCPSNTKSANVRQSVTPSSALPPPSSAAKTDGKADSKAAPAGPKTTAELEQDFRKRRAEQEEAAKKEQEKMADAKAREENCRNSRSTLASLESGVRQTRVNDKGERVTLEDAQLAQETDRTRKAVQEWCK
jgi:hypothetical protein